MAIEFMHGVKEDLLRFKNRRNEKLERGYFKEVA